MNFANEVILLNKYSFFRPVIHVTMTFTLIKGVATFTAESISMVRKQNAIAAESGGETKSAI